MIFVFDTETTCIRPGQICQISYVLATSKGATAKNFYFTVDSMDAGAQGVHGLSMEYLAKVSQGKRWSDHVDEIMADFCACDAVAAHNANFDMTFLRTENERIGRAVPEKPYFDTMREYTPVCKLSRKHHTGYKFPKLCELTQFLALTDEDILAATKDLFSADCGFHDARFDATAVYLALLRAADYDGIKNPDLLQKLD